MNCCFIGHRNAVGIEEKILKSVLNLYRLGVVNFYSGGMGNFDKMCEKAVKKIGAKLIFVPYNCKQIKNTDLLWYDEIICFSDKNYSIQDIPNRNKWLVAQCEVCLCYVFRNGGAKTTLDYAIKSNKQIINLANWQKTNLKFK